jgi:hypothetical protein
MKETISATQARTHLGELTRHENWRELVQQAREQFRAEIGKRALPPSEEVLRQTREQRDEQLDVH